MPFEFLKYLQPTHYFHCCYNGKYIFPVVNNLPEEFRTKLSRDSRFKTSQAQQYDLSWQAMIKGYIGDYPTYENFDKVELYDNYVFIRKYFNKVWVFYTLCLRIITFHNPFIETVAWFKSRHVQRIKSFDSPIPYANWSNFESKLIKRSPKVSVVIPTLNRYEYLSDVLRDFEKQDYSNFEVVVVDQSDNFNKDFYKSFNLDFVVINQKEKALWLARNNAIRASKGDLIALSEDDVRVQKDWLSSHLKCLDFFNAQISAGVFYPEGQGIPKERSFFAIASQFATGNAMLFKSVFKKVGLFDRQFEGQRMGDGEFGLRCFLNGIKSVSNPHASCIDVKAGTGGLREMGSWDAFRPSNFFSPRPIPSVLYFFRRYFGNKAARFAMLRTVPISVLPYRFKKSRPLQVFGAICSVFILPLVFYQVYISWVQASKKIKKGPMIDSLS